MTFPSTIYFLIVGWGNETESQKVDVFWPGWYGTACSRCKFGVNSFINLSSNHKPSDFVVDLYTKLY